MMKVGRLFGKPSSSNDGALEKTLSETLVKDVMSKQLIIAHSSTTIFQIAKMMEQGIGAILVKNDSIPIGIITDRDFATKIAANKYPLDTPVGKIASMPLQTIGPNESILDAAMKMSSKKIRKLVVVEDVKVIGIITSTDLVNRLSEIKI
ncbi:MAG: signal-transduction protein [Nitrosarchaeum sp.]|jgi:CBS domain-containing protein|nr:signal-transduction protein [Nitrosarchaeum sp.]